MSKMSFLFDHHIVSALYPVADAFATAVTTDWISLAHYGRITFVIHTGLSTSDTSNGVITVNCSTVAAGSSPTALAFKYQRSASSTTVDTWGALTDVASTGLTMTAADNNLYIVELLADEIEAAAPGKKFVSVTVTEGQNDPIVAGILAILSEPRYPQAVPFSAIA